MKISSLFARLILYNGLLPIKWSLFFKKRWKEKWTDIIHTFCSSCSWLMGGPFWKTDKEWEWNKLHLHFEMSVFGWYGEKLESLSVLYFWQTFIETWATLNPCFLKTVFIYSSNIGLFENNDVTGVFTCTRSEISKNCFVLLYIEVKKYLEN